jgi:hypothetical protein
MADLIIIILGLVSMTTGLSVMLGFKVYGLEN